MSPKPPLEWELRVAARILGARGGRKGGKAKGPKKRRGDSDYYRKIGEAYREIIKKPKE